MRVYAPPTHTKPKRKRTTVQTTMLAPSDPHELTSERRYWEGILMLLSLPRDDYEAYDARNSTYAGEQKTQSDGHEKLGQNLSGYPI